MSDHQIIVVPGLFGSIIEARESTSDPYVQAWPGTFSANGNAGLLAMSVDTSKGTATAKYDSQVTGIVTDTSALGSDGSTGYLGSNGYSALVDMLNQQFGSENVHQLYFDWRYDLDETVNGSSQISKQSSLASRISAVVEANDLVSVVCHSMGCLAMMIYLSASPYNFDNFDKVVFMAPPFYGTVEAYYRLVFGESPVSSDATDEEKEEWKGILTTMPGIYQICPSSMLSPDPDTADTGGTSAFLNINNSLQTWTQAYYLDGSGEISMDSCVQTSILATVGAWNTALAALTTKNDSFLIGLYEIGYLGYGSGEETYDFVVATYSGDEVLPSDGSKTTTDGDGNVLTKLISDLAMQESKLFPSTTHMELVQNSDPLKWICQTLGGSDCTKITS